MDIFSLAAKIGIDSTGFVSGLFDAQQMFASFAGAVVGFSQDVMNTGLGFDAAMSSVQAVLGQEEGTVERMNELRAFALKQARDSIFTAEDTAQAYYYMGMAGWKSEQMMQGLPAIMALAAASGEDLGRVSDIVTDSLTAFGLSAENAGWYADVLAQTATNANTNVGLMGETFKYVAPIAGALGAGVDDVAVSIGLMANAGIKGSMAGTALRQIFTRISTNAGETKNKLGALTIITQELGVAFRDGEHNMRDWGDVIADVREKWKGLDSETQIYYAKQIASERGMAGWLALMNATEEDVQKLTRAINEAGGAAQTMSEVRQDNLAGDLQLLNSSFDVLKIAIYDDVKGPMREVVQWAAGALDDITNAINENGLAGGIEVLGEKIQEAGEMLTPMLEGIGKAAAPLLSTLLNSIGPTLIEAGTKIGGGLLKGLGDGMMEGADGHGGLLGVLVGGLGEGLTLISQVAGILKTAGQEGGRQMWTEVAAQADPVMAENPLPLNDWLMAGYDPMLIPDGISKATEDVAPDIQQTLENAASNAGANGGDAMAGLLEAAGDRAGRAVADSIANNLSSRTYTINVQANVSGLPAHQNASAMTAGRIYTRATVFGAANGQLQAAGDAGPEAVVGVGSLYQMIQRAVGNALGGAAFSVPRQAAGPTEVVMVLNDTVIGRALLPYIEAEASRVGVNITGVRR